MSIVSNIPILELEMTLQACVESEKMLRLVIVWILDIYSTLYK